MLSQCGTAVLGRGGPEVSGPEMTSGACPELAEQGACPTWPSLLGTIPCNTRTPWEQIATRKGAGRQGDVPLRLVGLSIGLALRGPHTRGRVCHIVRANPGPFP